MLRIIGGGLKGIEYQITSFSGSASATHTFSAHPIGDDKPSRYTVVLVTEGDLTTGVDTVTVGGNSATKVMHILTAYTVWIATAPAGTTADIVVTADSGGDGQLSDVGIHVISLFGISSSTPFGSYNPGANSDPHNMSVNIPSDGLVIGWCVNGIAGSVAWSGLFDDTDEVFDGNVGLSVDQAVAVGRLGEATPGTITTTTGSAHYSAALSWS